MDFFFKYWILNLKKLRFLKVYHTMENFVQYRVVKSYVILPNC